MKELSYTCPNSGTRTIEYESDDDLAEANLSSQRISICNTCDSYIKLTTTCKKCGCFMALKTRLKKSKCPLGKW